MDKKDYHKNYYQLNKAKYLASNRKRRAKLKGAGVTTKPDKFLVTVMDSVSGLTLMTKKYKSQKAISDDIQLPTYTICRIIKKNNNSNYMIEKI